MTLASGRYAATESSWGIVPGIAPGARNAVAAPQLGSLPGRRWWQTTRPQAWAEGLHRPPAV